MKAALNSIQKNNNETVTLNDVIEVVIQNYSSEAIEFTLKNVMRTIPAVDAVSGIPSAPFSMSALGHAFDIEFDIVFPSGTGKVIIDYSTLKKC